MEDFFYILKVAASYSLMFFVLFGLPVLFVGWLLVRLFSKKGARGEPFSYENGVQQGFPAWWMKDRKAKDKQWMDEMMNEAIRQAGLPEAVRNSPLLNPNLRNPRK